MFGLHSRLITQLANQPGFGWNSCNIFFFFMPQMLELQWLGSLFAQSANKTSFIS